jgi:hypothetical protein
MEVDDLPEELWMTVLGFLDSMSLVRLRVTNGFLRRLALDDRWTAQVAVYRRTADYLHKRRLAMTKHHGVDFRPAPLPPGTSIGPVPIPSCPLPSGLVPTYFFIFNFLIAKKNFDFFVAQAGNR